MEDKMIEIARFQRRAEAEMLANLLLSEGIDCCVRDGISSRVMFGDADLWEAKVELLQKDVRRASGIMKDHGYETPAERSGTDAADPPEMYRLHSGRDKAGASKAITIITILIILLFGLLVYLNWHFNG